MLLPTIIILAALSATLNIRAVYKGPKTQVYVFKPLTMVFILLIAILGQSAFPEYKYLIIAGLLFSLAGDIFLMLPQDRFLQGLIAFFIAHVFYIVAFAVQVNTLIWWPLLPLILFGAGMYALISANLGKLKIPVILYVGVILVMTWLAWVWCLQSGLTPSLLAFIGALLFVFSDAALAINRFRKPFRSYTIVNLTTYFSGQCLIAGSVGGFL